MLCMATTVSCNSSSKNYFFRFDNNEVEFSELTPPTSPGSTSSFEEYHKVGFLKISREEMDREKEEELVLLEPHPLESRDQELMSHDQLLASRDQEHLQIQTLPSNGLHTHKLKISQSHDRLQSHDQSHDQSRDQPKSGEESTQLYHLLLQIDEGASLFLPSESDTLPNAYLVCKLYCMSVPLTTGIMWRTRQPNFNIRQVSEERGRKVRQVVIKEGEWQLLDEECRKDDTCRSNYKFSF